MELKDLQLGEIFYWACALDGVDPNMVVAKRENEITIKNIRTRTISATRFVHADVVRWTEVGNETIL